MESVASFWSVCVLWLALGFNLLSVFELIAHFFFDSGELSASSLTLFKDLLVVLFISILIIFVPFWITFLKDDEYKKYLSEFETENINARLKGTFIFYGYFLLTGLAFVGSLVLFGSG